MAQNKTPELDIATELKQAPPVPQHARPAGRPARVTVDGQPLASGKAKLAELVRRKGDAELEEGTLAAELDAPAQAAFAGDGWLLAQAPALDEGLAQMLSDAGDSRSGVIELAQLELPTPPAATVGGSTAGASAPAAGSVASGGIASSLGGMSGVFGAAAGLGLAAGGGGGGSSAGSSVPPVVIAAPTTAAPVPTAPASEVISLFSDKYANVPVANWNPYWGQAGALSDARPINSDQIKRVLNLNYQGIQIAKLDSSGAPVSGVLDVSAKSYLRGDFWLEQAGTFTLKLVSKEGAVGQREDSILVSGVAGWNSKQIALSEFDRIDLDQIVQMVLVTGGDQGTVTNLHFDNVYFGGSVQPPVVDARPSTAAPAPTVAAGDVVSLFSDSYTNVPVSNWSPNWGQSGALSDGLSVNGNHIRRVTDLNYQGVEIAKMEGNVPASGVLDVSEKGHLHIDFWLEAAGSFTLELVSKDGAAATRKGVVQVSGVAGWNSLDINLAQFDGVDLSKIIQMVFVAGTADEFHFDNVYFAGTYTPSLDGQLVNGYIENAEVFQDTNGNGVLDNDQDEFLEPGEEPWALTNAFGSFNLVGAVAGGGSLIARPTASTTDTSTGLRVTNVFKAPADATVISPLSTLLEAGSRSGLTEAQIKTAFGLDPDVYLLDFDPVQAIENAAIIGSEGAANLALKIKAANVTVSNLMDVGSSLIQGATSSTADFSAAVVSSLVSAIQTAPLNLGSDAAVESILNQAASTAGVGASRLTELTAVIASTADKLSVAKTNLDAQSTVTSAGQAMSALTNMAKVEKAVQSTVAESVKAVAQNPTTVANLNNLNLNQAISDAAVTVQKFKTLGFEAAENVALTSFNGATATAQTLSGNTVVRVIKPAVGDEYNASGVSVSTGAVGSLKTVAPMDLVSQSELGMWVHSALAGTTVTLEVADSKSGGYPKDINFVAARAVTTKAGWEYLRFDFGNPIERYVAEGNPPNGAVPTATPIKPGVTYDMLSVFFDLGKSKSTDQTYYFDELGYFRSDPGAAPADIAIELAPAIPSGYTLAWSDEFGGDLASVANATKSPVNASVWASETGRGPNGDGWGNGESQTYTDSINNAYTQNGALYIAADKTGSSITSARLKSVPDVGPNAYVELRAKVPVGQGAWPAAWLLGQGQWPDSGEIDIMEWSSAYFNPSQTQSALHFRGENNPAGNLDAWTYGNTQKKGITTLGTPVTEFHTYQVWWTQDYIRFGVDANSDNAYYTYNKPANATSANWPFTGPMDLILNLAIGGSLGGSVPSGDFDYEMVVDYVRVYQGATGATPRPTTAAPTPTAAAADVISLFSDSYTNVAVNDWNPNWDESSSLLDGVAIGANGVKKLSNLSYQGVQIATMTDGLATAGVLDVSGKQSLHIDYWLEQAGSFTLKLISKDGSANAVEAGVKLTGNSGWNSIDIGLDQYAGVNLSKVIQALFVTGGNNGTATELHFDNLYFSNNLPTGATPRPTTAAPTPTAAAADVISLFSDSYTNVAVNDWNPNWDESSSLLDGVAIGANGVKKLSNLSYQGVQIATMTDGLATAGVLDVSGKQSLHIDYWLEQAGSFTLKLISKDGSANAVEAGVKLTGNSGWNSIDIGLDQYAGVNLSKVIQALFVTGGNNGTATELHFDNLYFSNNLPTGATPRPTTAAPTPTAAAADVISLFSDSYTNVAVNDWNPNWDESSSLLDGVAIGANGVKKLSNLSYQGVQIATMTDGLATAGVLDVSGKQSLHIDYWLEQAGSFTLKLISKDGSANAVEAGVKLTGNSGWNSIDIGLDQYAGVNLSKVIQALFVTGGNNGTATELHFDNLYFSNNLPTGATPRPTTAAPTPTAAAADVISLFSDSYTNVAVNDWNPNWDESSSLLDGVAIGANGVKKLSNLSYQGVQIATMTDGLATAGVLDVSGKQSLHIDYWLEQAGSFTLKLISKDGSANAVEAGVKLTGNSGWNSIDIGLDQYAGVNLSKVIQALFVTGGNNGTATELHFDNLYFSNNLPTGATPRPTTAAPTPTAAAADVISLFSDSYTNVAVNDWNPNWDESSSLLDGVAIGANGVKKLSNLSYQGVQIATMTDGLATAGVLDVSGKQSLHIDYWLEQAGSFTLKLISKDGSANAVEAGVKLTGNSGWNSIDIGLDQYAGVNLSKVIQALFVTGGNNGTATELHFDNLYFSNNLPTGATPRPTTAAPTPTAAAADVISLFSDSYTNVAVNDWNPNWDESSSLLDGVAIGANGVKKLSNLSYQGVQIATMTDGLATAGVLDVSGKQSLHIDYWLEQAGSFTLKLISKDGSANAVEAGVKLTGNSGWNSIDIGLDQYAGVNLSKVIQALFVTGGNNGTATELHFDNLYFSNNLPTGATPRPTTAAPTPTAAAADVISLFSDSYTNVAVNDWNPNWDESSSLLDGVAIGANGVKKLSNLSYQGVQIATMTDGLATAGVLDVSGKQSLHIDYWLEQAGSFTLKLISKDGSANAVEAGVKLTGNSGWNSIDIGLDQYAGVNLSKVIQALFVTGGNNGTATELHFDNLYFSNNLPTGATPRPTTAAPTPTAAAADVISLFSDSYTNVAVNDWNPNWDESSSLLDGVAIGANGVKKLSNLSYQGVQIATMTDGLATAGVLDVSGKQSLHIDYWLEQAGSFTLKLISKDGSANAVEAGVKLTGNSGWNSIDIGLDQYAGVNLSKVIQALFVTGGNNGTATELHFDNLYFSNNLPTGATPRPTTAAPTPTAAAADVISLFSDSYTNVAVNDWNPNWDESSSLLDGVAIGANGVKKLSNLSYQGVQIATMTDGLATAGVLDVSGKQSLHIDYWLEQAGSFTLKLISKDGSANAVEAGVKLTGNSGWNSIDIGLDQYAGVNLSKVIQALFVTGGNNGTATELHFDNLYFSNNLPTGATPRPTTAAPTPTAAAADVISLFSDSYTNVAVNDWNPNWDESSSLLDGVAIGANGVKKLSNLSYQGVQIATMTDGLATAGVLDVSGKQSLHIDYWLEQAGSFTLKLISKDGSANAVEAGVKLTGNSGWNSIDIGLDQYAGVNLSKVIQALFVTGGNNGTATELHFDNLYFSNNLPTGATPRPTTAAPTPTAAAADVISLFSDSYTNVAVNDWNPNWGQSGSLADGVAIGSNDVKKVLNLNYQGVQIATMVDGVATSGVLDVSGKQSLHIDYWLEQAGSFTLKLISKDGSSSAQEDGVKITGTNGWNSIDIDLNNYDAIDLSKVIQLSFVTGGNNGTATELHFDNLYFSSALAVM
jgi:beta-glucanase (GH16 family)